MAEPPASSMRSHPGGDCRQRRGRHYGDLFTGLGASRPTARHSSRSAVRYCARCAVCGAVWARRPSPATAPRGTAAARRRACRASSRRRSSASWECLVGVHAGAASWKEVRPGWSLAKGKEVRRGMALAAVNGFNLRAASPLSRCRRSWRWQER